MAHSKFIPAWLYELLPALYISGAVLGMMGSPNAWGILSGLLLASAAVMISIMRWNHRHGGKPAHGVAATPRSERAQLHWRDEYATGNALIDTQHQQLFDACERVQNAMLSNHPQPHVEALLEDLIHRITAHFSQEEELIELLEEADVIEHKGAHHRLLAKTQALMERYRNGEIAFGELFGFIAYEAVAQHIAKDDLVFKGKL